jgi:ribosomal protein S18 acetylase RimI-like enzyme
MLRIERAADMRLVREMLEEYGRATNVDLSFQDFDRELATLPYEYDPILIALFNERPAGCVALRRIDDATSEMKRLYVRPEFRGKDIGRSLALAIIAEGKARGFERMRLDTLPSMQSAIALYESLGFRDIAPYRFNPIAGTRYLELELGSEL